MSFALKQVGADYSVLYVMAALQEYGTHLQKRFTPLITGIGPVEAAIALASTLASLKAQNKLPDLVVSLGSAGSPSLQQTAIYQASSVSYRDMDASALGFEKGCTPMLDLPAIVPMPTQMPNMPSAHLSTGANIVNGSAYGKVDADMVDMETFACLRACQRFTLPLLALRGISDGVDDLNHIDDWTQYLHIIDEKMALSVDLMEQSLMKGTMQLPKRSKQ